MKLSTWNLSGRFMGALVIAMTVQTMVRSQASAAGFEKGIMWGARSAGVAGIASPYIAGSQSLYFNPAGLANDKEGQDVSLNLSPTFSQFKGPVNDNNDQATSDMTLGVPFGLNYARSINDKIGVGIGIFTSAGSKAEYNNVGFSIPGNTGATASVRTNLMVNELSLGLGYKISDSFKVGLAYRIVQANAEFGLTQQGGAPLGNGAVNAIYTGLKDTEYNGFRLGAQYKLDEKTRFGLNYRSEINIQADGTSGGTLITGAGSSALDSNAATVRTTLPMQLILGMEHEYSNWRALAELEWIQYSRVKNVNIQGQLSRGATIIQTSTGQNNVPLNFSDEYQLRLGGEYLGYTWPIRFGYAATSAVSDQNQARPTFVPPAMAHTLTVGSGQIFTIFEKPLQFDVAGEYSFSSGSGGLGAPGDTTQNTRMGTYAVNAFAAHLGLTYAF